MSRFQCKLMTTMEGCEGLQVCTFYFSFAFFHPNDNLALKSPKIAVNREFDDAIVFKMSSKSDINSSNSVVS